MESSVRSSESQWDRNEERECLGSFRGGDSPKWRNPDARRKMKCGDSRWPSWDPLQENRELLEDDDFKRDRRRIDTEAAGDGLGRHYDNGRSPDDGRRVQQRGMGRGRNGVRSRSPSWNRDRRRSRSRSRSRSPSRSRGRNGNGYRTHSRSPYQDGGHDPNEYMDMRSASRVSSRMCMDFALGKCRRGSQCRFLHQEIPNPTHGWNHGSSSGPEEHAGASRNGDIRTVDYYSRNKSSDGYRKCSVLEDENSNRCVNKNGKLICKLFLSGKCHRDDCYFSHDLDDKKKSWNGPSFDDVNNSSCFSDTGKNDIKGCNLENKSRKWENIGWNEKAQEKNEYLSDRRENKLNYEDFGSTEFKGIIKSVVEEETEPFRDIARSKTVGVDQNLMPEVSNGELATSILKLELGRDNVSKVDNSNALDVDMECDNTESPSLGKRGAALSLNFSNGPYVLNGSLQRILSSPNAQNQSLEVKSTEVITKLSESIVNIEQVAQMSQNLLHHHSYVSLNASNYRGLANSLLSSATAVSQIDSKLEQDYPERDSIEASKPEQENGIPFDKLSPISASDVNSIKPPISSIPQEDEKSRKLVANPVPNGKTVGESCKHDREHVRTVIPKPEDVNMVNDGKAMRMFKIALVEFVKEILKPTWKDGRMSREVHKTIVKKVVDKVTSTVQGVQMPRTQERVDQYMAFAKTKITKLVEAYVEKFLKGQ